MAFGGGPVHDGSPCQFVYGLKLKFPVGVENWSELVVPAPGLVAVEIVGVGDERLFNLK